MGIEKIKATLQKIFPKRNLANEDIPKFNRIPEDHELAHYKELERRNQVKNELQQYRDSSSILFAKPSVKNVFKSVVRESQVMTPEEKLLYEDAEPKPNLKIKGSKKKLSNKQIKSLLKQLQKSRIKNLGRGVQRLTGLVLPQPKVYRGYGAPQEIPSAVEESSILKSNVFWSEPQAPIPITLQSNILSSNTFMNSYQNNQRSMFWQF